MGGAARLNQVSNDWIFQYPGEPEFWPAFKNPSLAPIWKMLSFKNNWRNNAGKLVNMYKNVLLFFQ